jgi:hypothetical protein
MTEWVRLEDLADAFKVWWRAHGNMDKADARVQYARFLGGATLPVFFVGGCNGRWKLSPEQARRMRMLLGPHSYAIIKAYEANLLWK